MQRNLLQLSLFGWFWLHSLNAVSCMRLVVQRVKQASVSVEAQVVSEIGPGILCLVGLHEHDQQADLDYCCKKLLNCKLWENADRKLWRQSVRQKEYEILCVSQFTLYGSVTNRKAVPDYRRSMKSEPAKVMYHRFLELLQETYQSDKIKDGVFGALMDVTLCNDGPVTLVIETNPDTPCETMPESGTLDE